jgi:solute carrier family 45 protein 1/2/4
VLGTLRHHNGGQWSHTINRTYLVLITNSHQFLKELDSPAPERTADAHTVNHRVSHTRAVSSPNLLRTSALLSERQPLLTRRRSFEDQADNEDAQKHTRVAGGTILGIHNLAIVFPQFIVSLYRMASYLESLDF